MKRVPHAECEFPIFGVTLIPTGGSLSRKYPLTPVGGGLEWDSWARIWPPPKGSATAPEVGFEDIAIDLLEAPFLDNFRLADHSGVKRIKRALAGPIYSWLPLTCS